MGRSVLLFHFFSEGAQALGRRARVGLGEQGGNDRRGLHAATLEAEDVGYVDAADRDDGTDDGGNGLPPDDEPDLFSQEEQTE